MSRLFECNGIANKWVDNWDASANEMTKNEFGVWEVTVPGVDGKAAIPHDSKIKV